MAIIGGSQFLERITFFNGERLEADDLQTLESSNREMRWLHNQSLHQPGVGSGYAVTGNKGDRQVTVTPGYAIDACGREIVLTENSIQPVPPVAGDSSGNPVYYDLTVSYPPDSDLVESQTRQGICLPQGAVRLREAPLFCWIQLGSNLQPVDAQLKIDEQTNMRIVLARVQIQNCQLYQPVSTAQRRSARQPAQPRVVCGSAGPAGLNWQFFPASGASSFAVQLIYGVQVYIDTSAARFQNPPSYSAQVLGDRIFTLPGGESGGIAGVGVTAILDGWVNICMPTATGFTLQIVMPSATVPIDINPLQDLTAYLNAAGTQLSAILAGNNWTVVWMGVES